MYLLSFLLLRLSIENFYVMRSESSTKAPSTSRITSSDTEDDFPLREKLANRQKERETSWETRGSRSARYRSKNSMKRAFSIVNETWKRVWSKSLPRGADKRREILLWDDLEKWACISDEEIGGMSHAKLQTSSETTLFHGRLSTNTPAPDSTNKNRMKYSGYCAIRSQPNRVNIHQ